MSSHVSSLPRPASLEPTRRRLSSRQAETVLGLCDAALEELRELGWEGLTVRGVARRAGVAPATAYTYFGSKDHLVTEVFWRRLQALPDVAVDERSSVAERASLALAAVAALAAEEPELSAACSVGMLAADPDVKLLRDRIGSEIRRRLRAAVGADGRAAPADGELPAHLEPALSTMELVVSGALLQAGMGHVRYEDLPARLSQACEVILG